MNIFTILLVQPLANILILFYRLLGQNMGVAIVVFTIFLRLILNPLTKPYMDSMKKMKDLAPELAKLKERHKGDKKKTVQAQAEFYKKNGINPVGAGCVLYILQIVVLIAFFNFFVSTFSGEDVISKLNALLYSPLQFAPGSTINTWFLYLDVLKPDVIKITGISFSLPGPLLILSALSQFVSAKIAMPYIKAEEKIAKKTPEGTDDAMIAAQGSMIYMFPILTIFAGMSFPSGLAIYWLLFSAFQTYQQYKASGWGGLSPLLKKINLI